MSREIPAGEDLNVSFSLLSHTADALVLRYVADSVSAGDLYVFNVLHRGWTQNEGFLVDSNLVYAWAEDDQFHISKRIPDVPDNIDPRSFVIPCATVLAPGGRLTETLSLSLPLRPFQAYGRAPEPTQTRTFDWLSFSLGYFRVSEMGRRPVTKVKTIQGDGLYAYVSPLEQLVVRTPPLAASLTVRL